jgi:DNA-binding helix-hairpin-helix protein with protein kinase domain
MKTLPGSDRPTWSVGRVRADDLGERHEIGRGGMATVFGLPSFFLPEAPAASWVYKEYRSRCRPVPLFGMEALVRLRQALPAGQRQAFDRSFNWPSRVVVDDGPGAAGVILPLLPEDYFVVLRLSSGTTKRKPAEGQFLFMERAYCTRVGIEFPDDEQRRHLCRSLAYAFGLLERAGVVYGDLSARNLLFRLRPRPTVMLVDCDAVRLRGEAAAFGAQPHSPDWEPPEALRARDRRDGTGYNIQSQATDRYKLGLAILRMLTPGPRSSMNTDPAPARSHLPMHLFTLLCRSLSDDPAERPPAKTWYEELTR